MTAPPPPLLLIPLPLLLLLLDFAQKLSFFFIIVIVKTGKVVHDIQQVYMRTSQAECFENKYLRCYLFVEYTRKHKQQQLACCSLIKHKHRHSDDSMRQTFSYIYLVTACTRPSQPPAYRLIPGYAWVRHAVGWCAFMHNTFTDMVQFMHIIFSLQQQSNIAKHAKHATCKNLYRLYLVFSLISFFQINYRWFFQQVLKSGLKSFQALQFRTPCKQIIVII